MRSGIAAADQAKGSGHTLDDLVGGTSLQCLELRPEIERGFAVAHGGYIWRRQDVRAHQYSVESPSEDPCGTEISLALRPVDGFD
jgi:hypothetical protein